MSSRGKYNRYITFQTVTYTNTKGSLAETYADAFTTYARKESETSGTSSAMEKRTTESKSTWTIPYNGAATRDGRFYENNATTTYYYVVGLSENDYQTEITLESELRV